LPLAPSAFCHRRPPSSRTGDRSQS
jgi:hypothetical protein